jgi:hypothetical protein
LALRAMPGPGRVAQLRLPWLLLAAVAVTVAAAGSPAGSSPVEPRFESVGRWHHPTPCGARHCPGPCRAFSGSRLATAWCTSTATTSARRNATPSTGLRATWAGSAPCSPVAMAGCGSAPNPTGWRYMIHSARRVGACGGDSREHGGALPTIRALAEDAAGGIWVGSEGGGLERLRCTMRQDCPLPPCGAARKPAGRSGAGAAARSAGRKLWLGHLGRPEPSRRPVSERFEPVFAGGGAGTGLAGRIVQALLQASDGRIWVGTQQGELAIIDPATGAGVLLEPALEAASPGGVSSLVEAPGGQMWVGRVSGIEIRDVRSGALLQRLRHDLHNPRGLAANEVTTLLLDHSGLIWVGGFGVGLQRHDPGRRSLWLRGADRQPGSILSVPDVRSLLQVDNGEIWAATHNGGVAVLDQSLRTTGAVVPRLPAPAGSGATICRPRASRPWRRRAMARSGWGPIRGSISSAPIIDNCACCDIVAVRRESCSLAATGRCGSATQDGVFRLPAGATEVVRIAQRDGQLLRADINALVEAADGSVWVGSGKGLFRVAAGANQLQAVGQQEGSRPWQSERHRSALRPPADPLGGYCGDGAAPPAAVGWRARCLRAHQPATRSRQPAVWRQSDAGWARPHLDADVRLRPCQRPDGRADRRRWCRSRHRLVSRPRHDA